MDSAREVLVPVDFSGASERACDFALELAWALGSPITLLRVVESPSAFVSDPTTAETVRATEAGLLADRAELMRPLARALQTVLVAGTPSEEIDRVAVARNVALVVVGTHGRRGFARAVLGSVAEKVVRSCRRPVVTVPSWAFLSRADAAEQLVHQLRPLVLDRPMAVALSQSAVPLALRIAEALGGSSDVWPVSPVVIDDRVEGAVTEQGDAVFDAEPRGAGEEEAREVAVEAARRALSDELMTLRGTRSIGEVWSRDLVLVADGLTSPAPMLAALRSLRSFSPRRIVVAVPVASRSAIERIVGQVDRLVCLESTVACTDPEIWYRDATVLSARTARARIDEEEPARVGAALSR